MFLDDSKDGGIGEDRTNAMYICDFLTRRLPECTIVMSNVTDCEMKADGVYYTGIKQAYIYSFYPLEWYFTDPGSDVFWTAYMAGEFDLINHPLNLITQSKAFWAYMYTCVDRQEKEESLTLFTSAELMMIHDMIPRYYFAKPSFFSFTSTINKPLFFRE
jgi:hypothetical protein